MNIYWNAKKRLFSLQPSVLRPFPPPSESYGPTAINSTHAIEIYENSGLTFYTFGRHVGNIVLAEFMRCGNRLREKKSDRATNTSSWTIDQTGCEQANTTGSLWRGKKDKYVFTFFPKLQIQILEFYLFTVGPPFVSVQLQMKAGPKSCFNKY